MSDDDQEIFPEWLAVRIVQVAVRDQQEQKLLNCLANGGGVTIDPTTMRLVFITEAQLESLVVTDIGRAPS